MRTMTVYMSHIGRRVQLVTVKDTVARKGFRWMIRPETGGAVYSIGLRALFDLGGLAFPTRANTESELVEKTQAWAREHTDISPRARWIN